MAISLKINFASLKGVLPLAISNSIAKSILAIGSLVLAKLYGPQDFGIYNAILSIAYIFTVVVSFNLDSIIMLIRDKKDANSFFHGTFWTATFNTLIGLIVLFFINYTNVVAVSDSNIILIILAMASWLTVINNSQISLLTKNKEYYKISVLIITLSVATIGFQFIFHQTEYKSSGLVYGWALGLLLTVLCALFTSIKSIRGANLSSFKNNVRKYADIIKHSYFASLVDVVSSNLFVILTLAYFSASEVGVYSLASKILTVPLSILSASFLKFYAEKATALYEDSPTELIKLTKSIILVNMSIVLLFIILINSIGFYFLETYLDKKEWPNLQSYLLILSFWILSRSMVNPISSIISVIQKNRWSLIFNTFILFISLLSLYIGVKEQEYLICIIVYSLLSSLAYIILLMAIIKNLKENARKKIG